MKTHTLFQIDAFTDRPLEGNPCAVVFDADDLDEATMLAIAREMNLSETAFVLSSERADFGARYFTPAEEIPMAGHPTIATCHALVDSGRLTLTGERTEITLELPAGVIPVEIRAHQGRVTRITMTQLRPEFFTRVYSAEEILPLFGLSPEDALEGAPIHTVSTGTPLLMIPLESLEALRSLELNISGYRAVKARGDFFSAHLFCLEGVDGGDTFARHLGVPPDLPEDPFTGSATGCMAAYLWHHGLIRKPSFIAEQGHWMDRPGRAFVERVGPPEDLAGIRVGGAAVTVFRGELSLWR